MPKVIYQLTEHIIKYNKEREINDIFIQRY